VLIRAGSVLFLEGVAIGARAPSRRNRQPGASLKLDEQAILDDVYPRMMTQALKVAGRSPNRQARVVLSRGDNPSNGFGSNGAIVVVPQVEALIGRCVPA
jgi:hypothetical protein